MLIKSLPTSHCHSFVIDISCYFVNDVRPLQYELHISAAYVANRVWFYRCILWKFRRVTAPLRFASPCGRRVLKKINQHLLRHYHDASMCTFVKICLWRGKCRETSPPTVWWGGCCGCQDRRQTNYSLSAMCMKYGLNSDSNCRQDCICLCKLHLSLPSLGFDPCVGA